MISRTFKPLENEIHGLLSHAQRKITTRQAYKRLGARKYHEWWNKIYKEASGNEQNC